MKDTQYKELKNILIVVSFNQEIIGDKGKFQPVLIEARANAVTTEGAVRNVSNTVFIGDISDVELTNEEIYKQVFGISKVLAEALKGVLLAGIGQDVSGVDVSKVRPVEIKDIK